MLLRTPAAPTTPRRGVILLIVVILLSLFMVVGLSFVLYAESEATASRIYREAFTINYDRADVPPEELLKQALSQIIYDVPDIGDGVYSALRGHSFARNMYGWNDPALTGAPNPPPRCRRCSRPRCAGSCPGPAAADARSLASRRCTVDTRSPRC